MVIGLLVVEIHFPHARSLKDKRHELQAIKSRLKNRFNAAIAELDFHEMWQRTALGIVTINHERLIVEQILDAVRREIESNVQGEVLNAEIRLM